MNAIFCSVFNHEKYVDMFYILLESMLLYGNLDDNTHILVYTSTLFMNMIKLNHFFNDKKIKFEINDTYNNIDKACKARCDVFNLASTSNYKKILYLDTDIVIKDNINKVFDVCKEDLLYVLEEGNVNDYRDFWGKTLFGDEYKDYDDITAFTSGILLFNNCKKLKCLFNRINEDMHNRPHEFSCYDQPYIVYNSFKYNLCNNKLLKPYVVNHDSNIHSDKVIHHFPGGPGFYPNKIIKMADFLQNMKYKYNIKNINIINNYIIQVGSHIRNTSNDLIFNNIDINLNLKYILIEPVPYLFNKLKENYKQYSNIIFLNIAISDYNGLIDLYVPSNKNDFLILKNDALQLSPFSSECIVDKIYVPCKTLNTLIKEYNITQIDYLYTNTEGHDYDILMDLNILLIRPKNIVFENKDMNGPKNILDINDYSKYINLLNHFKEYGYEIETENSEHTHIKLFKTLNIEDDIWTCSSKMRYDIYDFFRDKTHFKIAEIGSHKGYSTKILSRIFSKVYAIDNNIEWTNFNRNFNKDSTNIEYAMLDIYKESWDILPHDIDVSFIDACHDYNSCKSDIFNSIKQFKNLKYIIFDDYGVWDGVKQIVDELIENKILIFEIFIGINDVPGLYGIVKNVNEGIICSINYNFLDNKRYTWGDSNSNLSIQFLSNFKMDAFGEGWYEFIDKHNIIATFGGKIHNIQFNDNYTYFFSNRKNDSLIVVGKLL